MSNTGSGTMAWTASSNQSWLTVSPASGTNSGTLAIGANLSGMAGGHVYGRGDGELDGRDGIAENDRGDPDGGRLRQ